MRGLGLGLGLTRYGVGGAILSNALFPALNLNFLSGTLDPRITFTRSSPATRINASGVIESVGNDVARFDYDPATLAAKGLLIEEQRTNLLLNSLINGTSLSTQGVTVTAVAHTISFYGTGTITLTGAHAATVTGTGAYPNRQTLTFTPTAGTLTCTVSGSVQHTQLEVGSFATSFIPTEGVAVLRSTDVAVMTGTNFSSWYNQTEGTFVLDATTGGDILGSTNLGARNNAVTSIVGFDVDAIGTYRLRVVNAGANEALVTGVTPIAANTRYKIAGAYKANDFAAAANGGAVSTDTAGTVPADLTFLAIGSGTLAGATSINGHMRSINYYNTRLPNAQLQSISA